ncbi:MAG: hypothetical protein RL213_1803 [Bacteroidota bacterium]|jgi:hypothetical protein
MTKPAIRNLDELRNRIRQLKVETKELEKNLLDDYENVKAEFRPENILMRALSKLTGININKGEFLRNGVFMGISMLLQRFVFKTETSFERKVYGWIDRFFDQLKYYTNKFSKSGSVRSEKIEEEQ